MANSRTKDPLETFRIAFPLVRLFVWNDRIDYKFDEEDLARKAAMDAGKLIQQLDLPLYIEVDKRFQWGNEWILKIILKLKNDNHDH